MVFRGSGCPVRRSGRSCKRGNCLSGGASAGGRSNLFRVSRQKERYWQSFRLGKSAKYVSVCEEIADCEALENLAHKQTEGLHDA